MAEPAYDSIPPAEAATVESKSFVDRARDIVPDSVNLDVLDPSTDFSPQDRGQLLVEYCQPWKSFASPSNFNLPPLGEWKGRIKANVASFFYNYFVIALAFFALYSVTHFGTFIQVVILSGLAYLLFVQFPEDIHINEDISITAKVKKAIMGLAVLLAFFKGGLGCLIFSLGTFLLVVVGIHASIFDSES